MSLEFSYPAALATNADNDSGNDYHPQVTTDGAGHWVAVWGSRDSLGGTIGTDSDILVARSSDNGATWTKPAALARNADSDSGDDLYPQVATDGAGHWVAIWDSDENLRGEIGTDSDIFVARSSDNGATWTKPAALARNADSDSGDDFYPQITTDGAGHWVAVWNSYENLRGEIGTDSDVLVARSSDNGATWTRPAALNTNADSDSGNDYHVQVATDESGHWVAVWDSNDSLRGKIGTDWDILVARSTDNGATWTKPAALAGNANADSGVDEYPSVTTDRAGHWVAVWDSGSDIGTIGRDIFAARSVDNGATWTVSGTISAAADFGLDMDGDPQMATDVTIDWESGADSHPQVTTDGAGNWVAVWESDKNLRRELGRDSDVLVARSVDDGVTWTAPVELNTNAASDSGDDYHPQLTTDGAGNWVAVWDSNDRLGGGIGGDRDILMATGAGARYDFGDAPEPYPTLASANGPVHRIVPDVCLGTLIDEEVDGQPTDGADGDDNGVPDDEDGLVDPAGDLDLLAGQTPTVDVRVTNNTGTAATLYGWIDYNGDGVFDNATERASTAVPDGSTNVTVALAFPAVPPAFASATYARFRLSTDTAAAAPTGEAGDGEVEDYSVVIAQAYGVALVDATTALPEGMDTTSRFRVADVVVSDDALGTNALSLAGADASLFEVEPTSGTGAFDAVLYLKAGAVLDSRTNPILDVTVQVDDVTAGGTPDGTAALAITILAVESLGSVDFLELEDVDPSVGDVWYSLETIHEGFLTIVSLDPGGAVTLYDESLGPALPLAGQRADGQVAAGEKCYVQLSGNGSAVDLCICNLVHHEGTDVIVYGTEDEDVFEFDAAASRLVTVNRVPYDFTDAEAASVSFQGAAAADAAILYGNDQDETVELWPGRGTLTGEGYSVAISSVEEITAIGREGIDVARLYDDPLGIDTFVAGPDRGELSGDGFSLRADSFRYVHAYATAGSGDVATLDGDPDRFDEFRAWPNMAKLFGETFFLRAMWFDSVYSNSTPGTGDLAKLYDSPANDTFTAWPDRAKLSGDSLSVRVNSFRWVHSYSTEGDDVATFYGSDGRDVFVGTDRFGKLRGTDFYNRAVSYGELHVYGRNGSRDVAVLRDAVLKNGIVQPDGMAQVAWLYEFERIRQRSDGDETIIDAVDRVFTAYWQ